MSSRLGNNLKRVNDDSSNVTPPENEKQDFGGQGYYNGFTPDPERQGGPRKMSRIDKPISKSISGSVDGRRRSADESPDSADITVGKQLELEAGNAIQYRTCSWQKV